VSQIVSIVLCNDFVLVLFGRKIMSDNNWDINSGLAIIRKHYEANLQAKLDASYDEIMRLQIESGELLQCLNEARLFIEKEYKDETLEADGERLSKDARPIHYKICSMIGSIVGKKP
jgi:hypothetical protein